MSIYLEKIKYYLTDQTINYSILLLLVLLSAVLSLDYMELNQLVIPVVFGILATSLADTHDGLRTKLGMFLPILICFALASISTAFLINNSVLFTIALALSSFSLILLGAIGKRFASLAFSSLFVAFATMLSVDDSQPLWLVPSLILSGMLWYYLLAILWGALFPNFSIAQRLASSLFGLAELLEAVADSYLPTENKSNAQTSLKITKINAKLVDALNECKNAFLAKAAQNGVSVKCNKLLTIYFLAQDIHEKIISDSKLLIANEPHFQHSDLFFRIAYLFRSQAKDCRNLAQSVRYNKDYQHNEESACYLAELKKSLKYLRKHIDLTQNHLAQKNGNTIDPQRLSRQLESVHLLLVNMTEIETLLANPLFRLQQSEAEDILHNNNNVTYKEKIQQIKANLNIDSLLFRHAFRLSMSLSIGHILTEIFHIEFGYWVLLTILFVCQPNYAATRQRVMQRVMGTLMGLVVGAPLVLMAGTQMGQLFFIIVCCVGFYYFRIHNYGFATIFATVLVMVCFEQSSQGAYQIIIPRLLDTFIGAGLAYFSIWTILPKWDSDQLLQQVGKATLANKAYFLEVFEQYRQGKNNKVEYRIARRNAHNCEANLTYTIHAMMIEPKKRKNNAMIDKSFQLLSLNHLLLSNISTLGAHRSQEADESLSPDLSSMITQIEPHFDSLAMLLNNQATNNTAETQLIALRTLVESLSEIPSTQSKEAAFICHQLELIGLNLVDLYHILTTTEQRPDQDSLKLSSS